MSVDFQFTAQVSMVCGYIEDLKKYIPHRGKFSLVQIFVEMRLYPSKEVVIFVERTSDHTPPDDATPHMHVYRKNDTE